MASRGGCQFGNFVNRISLDTVVNLEAENKSIYQSSFCSRIWWAGKSKVSLLQCFPSTKLSRIRTTTLSLTKYSAGKLLSKILGSEQNGETIEFDAGKRRKSKRRGLKNARGSFWGP